MLRGQVFDQMRSDKLNANSWVNVARGTPKPKLKQHEYGANVGGPIIKGRLFFFANFDSQRQKLPIQTTDIRTQTTGFLTLSPADQTAVLTKLEGLIGRPYDEREFRYDQTFDQNTFLGKVDLLPTAAQRWTLSGNYTDDDADGEIPTGIAGALVLPSAARLQEQESLGFTLLQTTVNAISKNATTPTTNAEVIRRAAVAALMALGKKPA